MRGIQSILAATDFSSYSRYAAERAAMLGATLAIQRGVLLHVLEQSWLENLKQFIGSSVKAKRKIIKNASQALDELADQIREGQAHLPHVPRKYADAIVEAASVSAYLYLAHVAHRSGSGS